MNRNERIVKAIKAALDESEGVDVVLPYEAVTAMVDHFEAVSKKFEDLVALEQRLNDLILTHKTYVQACGNEIEKAADELEGTIAKEKEAAIEKIRRVADERSGETKEQLIESVYQRARDYIDDRIEDTAIEATDNAFDKIKEEWSYFKKDIEDEINYKLAIGIIRKNCRD